MPSGLDVFMDFVIAIFTVYLIKPYTEVISASLHVLML